MTGTLPSAVDVAAEWWHALPADAAEQAAGVQRLSLDHIVRYRDGGPDTVDNLRVLCTPCNVERG